MTEKPRVAIIGAGPAGCTLARLLLNHSIPVTVFEGEESIDFRAQGGTLDLHTETGQKALKEAGLHDEFLKYARFDGEAIAVIDKNLQAYLRLGGTTDKNTSRGRPEIDRESLRRLLLESLPKDSVRWGSRLRSVEPNSHVLHFDHGEEKNFDLLVGADGAWSKVRPLLSPAKPHFAGLSGFQMVIDHASKKDPRFVQFANRGSVFSFSDGKGISVQQIGDDSLSVSPWQRQENEKWMDECGYDVHNPVEVKAAILEQFADWNQLYKDIVLATEDTRIQARNLYLLPEDHKWENKPGVTLIGDAAHLMLPFAGEGVNLALDDALRLSREIVKASKSGFDAEKLTAGIKAFERDMNRRAAPMASVSTGNMVDMFFTPGAPRTTIQSWVQRVLCNEKWFLKLLLPQWFIRFVLRWAFWW